MTPGLHDQRGKLYSTKRKKGERYKRPKPNTDCFSRSHSTLCNIPICLLDHPLKSNQLFRAAIRSPNSSSHSTLDASSRFTNNTSASLQPGTRTFPHTSDSHLQSPPSQSLQRSEEGGEGFTSTNIIEQTW